MDRSLYKRLGDYILPTMEKNVGLKVRLSQGINNNKYFQNPRQVAQDSENDQIVRCGQFAFNKATTRNGEKISIAYRDGEDCTVSSAYQVFYIKDEGLLNPYYLMMWFKRPEFDRYARFKSHGSAHEFFTFEEMCNVLLPVPPIEEQRRIVSEYQTVERRIQNNELLIKKLEETAQAIYHHTFVEGIDENNLPEGWRKGCIGDLGEVVGGATPSTEKTEYWVSEGINWLSPADMPRNVMFIDHTERHITQEAYNSASTKMLPIGSVLFSSRAPIGLTAITDIELCTNQGYKSVIPLASIGSLFVYYTLIKEKEKIANQQEGSTFAEISGKELASYPIILPTSTVIENFTTKVNTIAKYRKYIERESAQLRSLLSLLTSKLS